MQYKLVACGGTFDYLHKGHKEFLRFVLSIGKNAIIGLTSDEFVHTNKTNITSFVLRKRILEDFLQKEHLLRRVTIVPIHTIYGPTIQKDVPIEALVVTEDTKKGGEAINKERKKYGLPSLPIVSMQMVTSENISISSSNIRKGIMDTNGTLFVHPSYFTQTYILPFHLREQLHRPFGKLLTNGLEDIKKLNPQNIISIGDVTTSRFNKAHIEQKLSVIDFIVERKKSFDKVQQLGFTGSEEIIHIANPPGMITPDTWKVIQSVITRLEESKRFILSIAGEEDLVFVPLLLTVPLGFHLFYGQPHKGLVHVESTLENKEKMSRIFQEFSPESTRGY